MDAVKKIIKDKGQRFTSQKKEIFYVLKKKPQTVAEIYKKVNLKRTIMDKATVYRILTNFLHLGVVNKIQLNRKEAHFELADTSHHHHLVCEECGKIEDIQLPEKILLKEVEKKSKFSVKSHSLEFYGTCTHCQ